MNLLLALVFRLLLALLQTPFVLADPPCEQLQPRAELAYSPPQYPSPWMDPEANGWEDAYAKAKDFVSQLTLLEKVNITTGTGCVSR
jgi:ABC-type sugar transport system substrate-binding protein